MWRGFNARVLVITSIYSHQPAIYEENVDELEEEEDEEESNYEKQSR